MTTVKGPVLYKISLLVCFVCLLGKKNTCFCHIWWHTALLSLIDLMGGCELPEIRSLIKLKAHISPFFVDKSEAAS